MKNHTTPFQSGSHRIWRDSHHVSAFVDSERYLGHVVQTEAMGAWHAYDATRLNPAGNQFRYVGGFDTVTEAKVAVEASVFEAKPLVFSAGSSKT